MSERVTITINGRQIETAAGATILNAAKKANIHIPNLCGNDDLSPYGACRLCLVEITHKSRTRLVASCIYEVADGLAVETNADRVLNVRRLVIELLLSRNPHSPVLREIAGDLGVKESRFPINNKGCILCGMCVRTCREVVEVSAINFKGRGVEREVTTPFEEAPELCIACGSCAYVCPVQVIPFKEENGVRKIWNTDFPVHKCEKCGRDVGPVKQLEHFQKITDLPEDHFKVCNYCR